MCEQHNDSYGVIKVHLQAMWGCIACMVSLTLLVNTFLEELA